MPRTTARFPTARECAAFGFQTATDDVTGERFYFGNVCRVAAFEWWPEWKRVQFVHRSEDSRAAVPAREKECDG